MLDKLRNIFRKKETKVNYIKQRKEAVKSSILIAERKKQIQSKKVESIFNFVPRRVYIVVTILTIIAVFIIYGLPFLRSSYLYRVSEVQITGNNVIELNELESITNSYKGQSLLNLSSEKIEQDIKKKFMYVQEVYVWKELPGKLFIEVFEDYPVGALINLEGIYFYNENGEIVNEEKDNKIPLEDYEIELLNGDASIDDLFLVQYYLSGLTDEEKLNFSWESVSDEQKQQLINTIKTDLDIKINNYFDQQTKKVSDLNIPNMVIIESFSKTEADRVIDKELVANTFLMKDWFAQKNLEIINIIMQTDYSIVIELTSRKVIFSTIQRPLNDQLKDLDTIYYNNNLNGYSVFDVRTSNYTYY